MRSGNRRSDRLAATALPKSPREIDLSFKIKERPLS